MNVSFTSAFMEPLGSALGGLDGPGPGQHVGPDLPCVRLPCAIRRPDHGRDGAVLSAVLVAPRLRSHSSLISAVRRNPIPQPTLEALMKHSVPGQPE